MVRGGINPLELLTQLDNQETTNLTDYQARQIGPVEYLKRCAEIREDKRFTTVRLYAWMQSEKIQANEVKLRERIAKHG